MMEPDIAMIDQAQIQRVADEIAAKFKPERIVLFGSYAYGRPHKDSDVDLLIVMRGRNVHNRNIAICEAVDFPFPVDVVVRSPGEISKRIGWGDSFLIEIETKGKVLYESSHTRMDRQSRRRFHHGITRSPRAKVAKL